MKPSPLVSLLRDNPLVVTGLGSYCAAGDSVEALWRAVLAGRSLAAWREFPVAGQPSQRFAVCSALPIDISAPALHSVRKADRCARRDVSSLRNCWSYATRTRCCAGT